MIKNMHWLRVKGKRLLTIFVAVVIYAVLLIANAVSLPHMTLLLSLSYGFSAFIALAFLAVGALVWLYARDRLVAMVLFCFSCTAMVPFALETAAVAGDQFFTKLSGVCASLALMLCSVLLLLFPRNYLEISVPANIERLSRTPAVSRRLLLVRCYAVFIFAYCIVGNFFSLLNARLYALPTWQNIFVSIYSGIVLVSTLITVFISYYQSSLRERQQLRLFVSGVVLSLGPFLVLTILPEVLHPSAYVVDPQLSTLSVLLLPLSLGYSILRYQILVLDAYVRRAVAWLVGIIFLAVLCYLVVTLSSFLLNSTITQTVIYVAAFSAVLAPCAWWAAKAITERLFFNELRYYRRIIESPALPIDGVLSVEDVSRLFTLAATQTFETPQVCLFALDEGTGSYCASPPIKEDSADENRQRLLDHLLTALKSSRKEYRDCLDVQLPAIERIACAQKPLLLSAVVGTKKEFPGGLDRYLVSDSSLANDLLLVPVRAQGRMIGLLVLGERGDQQPYAGPDFEIIQLILTRFSSLLETARLYARANQHAALLNSLYQASTMVGTTFQSVEEVASIYASVAASAALAGAEIWLYDQKKSVLRSATAVGSGPYLTHLDTLEPRQELDWYPWFYEARDNPHDAESAPSLDGPPCLTQAPDFPYAWLPLQNGEQRVGLLVLTYARPHFFLKEETHVLEMFANQCASALENARITMALRLAYERQKELDALKDQFIATASHELRTPLTAVQGYIELLGEYNTSLSTEERANFITRAGRGCDELTLLVENILDASRVRIDVENVRLQSISLRESVAHVLEILEAMTRREGRVMQVDIVPSTYVISDNMRLRQVLLNLVSNALKYSPPGSGVEITSEVHPLYVIVRVCDHGLGVPLEDQQRLFERFVRLERDMNSPTRGAGLGLYICKQLVEAMGGRIWVESSGREGDGSVFAFTLLRVQAQQEQIESGSQSDLSLPL